MNNQTTLAGVQAASAPPQITPQQASAAALIEAYASLCGVQEIMREECDAIAKRDPLERLVFDQDAAHMFAAELDHARQCMEIAFEAIKQEKAAQEQRERMAQSGLILMTSCLGH